MQTMQRKFFRLRDLASTAEREGRYPVAGSTIWRWVQRGEFPRPVKLTGGTTAWPVEAVEQWERERGTVPNNEGASKAAAASVAKRAARRAEGAAQ